MVLMRDKKMYPQLTSNTPSRVLWINTVFKCPNCGKCEEKIAIAALEVFKLIADEI